MEKLTLKNLNGVEVIDSREVAEAVDKEHSKLLRDIRTYCDYLDEAKIGLVDFFIESSYVDSKGEERPCYQVTKKGCEMIANKLTGKKGVTFTALYVNAFHDMEERLKSQQALTTNPVRAGEVASLVRVVRSVMKDQKSSPEKIALTTKVICDQCGINLPENFVEKKSSDGQFFLIGFKPE